MGVASYIIMYVYMCSHFIIIIIMHFCSLADKIPKQFRYLSINETESTLFLKHKHNYIFTMVDHNFAVPTLGAGLD